MYIQIEETPNPATIKFIPGITIVDGHPLSFNSIEEAHISPLASKILAINYIKSVFLGHDFISVTKKEEGEWQLMKPEILMTIMDHLTSGMPILAADSGSTGRVESLNSEDNEIINQIVEIIETQVRPAVAQDGGDIVFRSFENGIVKLELYGACSSCPSATQTLKSGIENMLKYYVPEVIAVEAIN